jgi:carboxypeptidase family protein
MRRIRLFLVVAVVALALAGPRAQVQIPVPGGAAATARPGLPPRDPTAKIPPGTSAVSGRVTASSSGSPLRHAQVSLNGADSQVRRATTTDGEGRYRFADLPAGRYFLSANKAGYVQLQYGQRRPTEPGTPLLLADGQAINAVNVALPRGSVIAGRVTDEFGEPIVRATVQALRYFYGPDGQRRPQPSGSSTTDDLGQFRVFGLSPGEYIVSASGQPSFMAFTGGPATVDTSETYLTSYYPGTSNILDAQTVPLTTGQEAMVQFALATGRLSRVAGTVSDSTGKPLPNAMATLQPASGGFLGMPNGGMTGPDGSFSLANVAPGDYVLNVQPVNMAGRDAPLAESSAVPLTVGDADMVNLRISTSRGSTVAGRVVFEGSARRDNGQGDKIRVFSQPASFQPGPSSMAPVEDDGSFEIKSARGSLLFRVAAGPAWTLKAVRHEGRDVTDSPIDVTGPEGVSGVTIVLTDKLTDVSGQVTDGRGGAVKDYLVVLQPSEPMTGQALNRYLRTVRPDSDGRYRSKGLPPGEYLATAVESLEQGRHFVPEVQSRLRDAGRRFTVREGQTVVLDLKLTEGVD